MSIATGPALPQSIEPASASGEAPANILAVPAACSRVAWPAEYSAWLDKTDRLVHLCPTWDEFAPANHRRQDVLGRPIGWFIADPNVRECFRALFDRVRREHRVTTMFMRCDQPAEVRAMQVLLVPLSAGAIEICWSFLAGAAARRVAAAPRYSFQHGELLRMCSWCHDVHLRTGWQHLEDLAPTLGLLGSDPLPSITHGICPVCCGALVSETATHRAQPVAV